MTGTSKFDLVVFDLDGTLIDAFEDITNAANHIRRLNQLPELSLADVKKHVGHGARQLVAGILPEATDEEVDANLAALVKYYEGLTESTATVYDEVLDTPGAFDVHIRIAYHKGSPWRSARFLHQEQQHVRRRLSGDGYALAADVVE